MCKSSILCSPVCLPHFLTMHQERWTVTVVASSRDHRVCIYTSTGQESHIASASYTRGTC